MLYSVNSLHKINFIFWHLILFGCQKISPDFPRNLCNKEHSAIYTRMLKVCEDDIERLKKEIAAITDYSATIQKRKAEMKESVDLIEQIIQDGAISDANLRLLVDSIIISKKTAGVPIWCVCHNIRLVFLCYSQNRPFHQKRPLR